MDAALRGARLRREFEKMLKAAGATKSQRVAVATELSPAVIANLLPLWRRVRLRVKG